MVALNFQTLGKPHKYIHLFSVNFLRIVWSVFLYKSVVVALSQRCYGWYVSGFLCSCLVELSVSFFHISDKFL